MLGDDARFTTVATSGDNAMNTPSARNVYVKRELRFSRWFFPVASCRGAP